MLAALSHPGHIVIYAPGDSLTCRRDASRNPLGMLIMLSISTYYRFTLFKIAVNYICKKRTITFKKI
ncbi:hypothetical protein CKY12_16855 [Photorhabdus sp. S12-55]|nr:hypothetical protein PluDJC_00925 [Photorhabdus laumondii subsp. laumondii]AXG45515.1 hypothetical protein PluTT01m_00870 [Photorhabdus laumondii subsp. laumondii]RAW82367.1 hypothetical protein CKY09_16985 [Photorhabdus sp. S5P8-50]RAW82519.1 hypothetical protein CKY12_16855 [Photorhabdus sp. S12-55]